MQIRYNIGTKGLSAISSQPDFSFWLTADSREPIALQHERKDSNPVRQFWRLTTLPGVRS
jgi:hypothetical protein